MKISTRLREDPLFIWERKMKIIQHILQKTKASKLWFSMVVVFIAMLSASAVVAKSLNKGEEFKEISGGVIRIISSDEVEIEGPNGILLGKYTVDGERMRVVTSAFGTVMVMYYKIAPIGLAEEKGGKVGSIYYSIKKVKEHIINNCLEARKRSKNADCNCAKAKLEIDKATDKEMLDAMAQQDRYFKERVEISRAGTAGTLSNDEIDNRRKSLSERERSESPDWAKSLNKCGKM